MQRHLILLILERLESLAFTGKPTQKTRGSEWRIRNPRVKTSKSFHTGQAKLRHVPRKMITFFCVPQTLVKNVCYKIRILTLHAILKSFNCPVSPGLCYNAVPPVH